MSCGSSLSFLLGQESLDVTRADVARRNGRFVLLADEWARCGQGVDWSLLSTAEPTRQADTIIPPRVGGPSRTCCEDPFGAGVDQALIVPQARSAAGPGSEASSSAVDCLERAKLVLRVNREELFAFFPTRAHHRSKAEARHCVGVGAQYGAIILLFVMWQFIGNGHWRAPGAGPTRFAVRGKATRGPEAGEHRQPGEPPARFYEISQPSRRIRCGPIDHPRYRSSSIRCVRNHRNRFSQGPRPLHRNSSSGPSRKRGDRWSPDDQWGTVQSLGSLGVGDRIYLTTTWDERLTYVVSQTPYSVLPSNVSVLNDFGDNRLTLTTCTPEFSSAERLVVVAQLSDPGPDPAVTLSSPHAYTLVATTDPGWDWGTLPAAVAAIVALGALGLVCRRLGVVWGCVRSDPSGPVVACRALHAVPGTDGLLPASL